MPAGRWRHKTEYNKSLPWDFLITEYLNGKTVRELAESVDVSPDTFKTYLVDRLKEKGLTYKGRYDRINGLPWDSMIERYLDGESANSLSKESGTDCKIFITNLKKKLKAQGKENLYRTIKEAIKLNQRPRVRQPSFIKGGYVRLNIEYFSEEEKIIVTEMCDKQRSVSEHRAVVAIWLGRPLFTTETVHHINGITTDNRLSNLQLRDGQHGRGQVRICLDCSSHKIGFEEL